MHTHTHTHTHAHMCVHKRVVMCISRHGPSRVLCRVGASCAVSAAFAAVIAVAKAGVLNVVAAQAAWTAAGGTFPPAIPGYCPTQCMSVLPTGLFLWSELTTQAAQSSLSLCVCDPETLQAALAAATVSAV